MPEPFLIKKAFDLSATAMGKATSIVIKGLIVVGLIALIVWAGYVTFIKPHTNPTPTQTAESMTNYTYNIKPLFGFGCMRIPQIKDKK